MAKLTREFARFIYTANLGASISGANNGVWTQTKMVYPFSVEVGGTFTAAAATVRVLVSNNDTAPLNSDNSQAQLGSDITGPAVVRSTAPYQWVKLAVLGALSSGSISSADYVGASNVNDRA